MPKRDERRPGSSRAEGQIPDPARRQWGEKAESQAVARELAPDTEEDRRKLDQFVSLVSHELRGPLATLMGYAQLLAQHGALPPELRDKAASAVFEQANRLNYIVDNLLQASRLAGGRLRMEPRSTNLGELVQRVVAHQQAVATHHRLVLDVPSVPIVGDWDADLIALALSNLISNAVKFSPPGSEVNVAVQRTRGAAIVSVTDHGIGIAPEDLPTIFEPYHRPARTERYPGIGVGLYVAKGIVEAHGGRIGVDSRPNDTTTFWFRLPLKA